MDRHEFTGVIAHVHKLYGDRFPGLTVEMATLWIEALRHFPVELAHTALRVWAWEHTIQPPSLKQLVTLMEDEQARLRRQRAAEEHHAVSNGERDDEYSTAEVRALIRSVWPDMFAPTPEPMKEEDRVARKERLRAQVEQILREEGR
jgi:hypothetical protein